MTHSVSRRTRLVQVSPLSCGAQNPDTTTRPSSPGLRTSRCVKYTMFFKNMLFLMCGLLIGAIGFVALKEKGKLNEQIVGLFLDPAAILFAVGVIIFVISLCGALGALRENKCLLRFFYVSIIIILLLEISLAIALYLNREGTKEKIDGVFQEFILNYHDDRDIQSVVDYVQEELRCCGSQGCQDWENNQYFNCSNDGLIVSACSVPYSCCRRDKINRMCGGGVLKFTDEERNEKVFTVGCLEAIENWIVARFMDAGIVAGCLVLLQLIAVWLACRMISDINDIIKWRDSH